jgi:hypothetical protein
MSSPQCVHFSELHGLTSPNIIAPALYNVLKSASVVDVGCGLDTWKDLFKVTGNFVCHKQGLKK